VPATPASLGYRRRGPVHLECVDRLWVDAVALLAGHLVPQRVPMMLAYAPPSIAPCETDALSAACLASLSTTTYRVLPAWLLQAPGIDAALQQLLDAGLVDAAPEAQEPEAQEEETAVDAAGVFDDWNGAALHYHYASRWSGVLARDEAPVDADGAARAFESSRDAFEQQTLARGSPPTHRPQRGDVAQAIALPRAAPTAFDELLAARETHRLFDPEAALPLAQVAQLLDRCFGVRAQAPLGGGLSALRKHAPSGGGMHPVEAYLLAANVQGLTPGWYHYRACDHELAPMRALTRDVARQGIVDATAGQAYFGTAPMIVALTLRFPRHHWKYPRHARAYRVMQLETGHVGQLFYLAATEAGLGAFITAAINDADVDATLGLDGIEEGCVAIVGCGRPSADGAVLRLSSYVAG
jgi:putative peptide maturation dehydrogenase